MIPLPGIYIHVIVNVGLEHSLCCPVYVMEDCASARPPARTIAAPMTANLIFFIKNSLPEIITISVFKYILRLTIVFLL